MFIFDLTKFHHLAAVVVVAAVAADSEGGGVAGGGVDIDCNQLCTCTGALGFNAYRAPDKVQSESQS